MNTPVDNGATIVKEAIGFYNKILEDQHLASTSASIALAVDAQTDPAEPRQLCSLLRPRFLSRNQFERVCSATTSTFAALKHLQGEMTKNPQLLSTLGLSDDHLALVRHTLGPTVGILGRFDGFIDTSGQVQFMEFNPFPGGTVYNDTVTSAFLEAPIMQAFRERYPVQWAFNASQMLPALATCFAKQGGKGVPCIAIVTNAGQAPAVIAASQGSMLSLQFEHSFEVQRTIGLLQHNGVPHVVAAPSELAYSPTGGLSVRGQQVNAVFVASWSDLIGQPASHPLFVATRDRAIWLLNSVVDTVMLGNKASLALLSDPDTNSFLTPPELQAVERHVPWTRVVRPGPTEYEGQRKDLPALVAAQKDDFVLKPADGWGGASILVGNQCTASQWDEGLHQALASNYVVQRLIKAATSAYPVLDNGHVSYVEHYEDIHPYIWSDTTPHGMGSRVSRSTVTNFKLGASLVPIFVLQS